MKYWQSEEYNANKKIKLSQLKKHITEKPKNILDIGCGMAIESEIFQKEYGSYLYLLDGNPNPNKKRTNDWGTSESFNFYNDIEQLKESFDERKLDYTFLDATGNVELPGITFDFVFSFLSCGFHYSVEEYISMIRQHSDENTLIMFDIRKHKFNEQMKYFKECDIIQTESKYHKVKVKL